MKYDPYVYENGVLKNKLEIKDEETLKTIERYKGSEEIELLLKKDMLKTKIDYNLFIDIHKELFKTVYDWAGQTRVLNISKSEKVLDYETVNYAPTEKIKPYLQYDIEELSKIDWSKLNKEETSKKMADKILDIWEVHPFRDGNTRTTLVFASLLAKKNNFELNLVSKENIRDIFAIAVYKKDKTKLYKLFLDSLNELGINKSKN